MQNGRINLTLTVFLAVIAFIVLTGLTSYAGLIGTEQLGTVQLKDGTRYFVVAQNYKNGYYHSEIWLQKKRWQSTMDDRKVVEMYGRLGQEEKEWAFTTAVKTVKFNEKDFPWGTAKEIVKEFLDRTLKIVAKPTQRIAAAAAAGKLVCPVNVVLLPRWMLEFQSFDGKVTGNHSLENAA